MGKAKGEFYKLPPFMAGDTGLFMTWINLHSTSIDRLTEMGQLLPMNLHFYLKTIITQSDCCDSILLHEFIQQFIILSWVVAADRTNIQVSQSLNNYFCYCRFNWIKSFQRFEPFRCMGFEIKWHVQSPLEKPIRHEERCTSHYTEHMFYCQASAITRKLR